MKLSKSLYLSTTRPIAVERLQDLVENTPDYAMLLLDIEGNILTWNRGAERIKGYKPEEIIGKHFSVFYTYADQSISHPQNELEIVKKVGRFEEEGWRVRKDGSQFWAHIIIVAQYNENHDLIGFAKITADLSEKKAAEENLRQSEEKFRLLVDGSKDYAILMLDTNGIVCSWNSGAERIKGYKKEEIIGKHFSIFYTESARKSNHPAEELIIAKEKGRYEEEGWRVRKDGSEFWANVILTPLYDNKEHLLGYSKMTRDLSERKKIELLKNEFVSTVTHELRTPLTSIKGSLDLLISGVINDSDSIKELLEIANSNCDRLIRLVNDILDIEKIEAGKVTYQLKNHSLNSIITEAVKLNQPYGQNFEIDITFENSPTDYIVNVDYNRLLQALTNLISNAVKFSSCNEMVTLQLQKKNEWVRVNIINIGPGIPDEFKNRIFQKFSQANASSTKNQPGTGLGLAITKNLIEQMGGRIGFDSIKNKTTLFYLDLLIV